MLSIAVTGAGGFVGSRFMLRNAGKYKLTPISLRERNPASFNFTGINAIVHLAGKAHDMKVQDEQTYFRINYELTRSLAEKAINDGVSHFIYISTIKVYGEGSDVPLNESSPCHPEDPYGRSKLKAEEYLLSLNRPGFTVSIVRPPVVIGPGVKGNINRLMAAIAKGSPLPLGNAQNQRTMVYVDNLVELINSIIDQKAAGIFLAGDSPPISTDQLISLIGRAMNVKTRLVSIPGFMRVLMKKAKPALYRRLFGSFVIDTSNTNGRLNFAPLFTLEQGIKVMVESFCSNVNNEKCKMKNAK